MPPLAVKLELYGTPTWPVVAATQATVNGAGAITTPHALVVAVVPAESVTRTVKLNVPNAVGVPLRTPAADKVNPAGNVPVASAYV